MKKFLKWILAGILTAGSIAMCVSAYGKFSDSVTVTNHISTGDINISMKELEKKNGKEILYQNQKMVLPGDRISKIPRITNRSEPCWVRVKITYADNLENRKGLKESAILNPQHVKKRKWIWQHGKKRLNVGEILR